MNYRNHEITLDADHRFVAHGLASAGPFDSYAEVKAAIDQATAIRKGWITPPKPIAHGPARPPIAHLYIRVSTGRQENGREHQRDMLAMSAKSLYGYERSEEYVDMQSGKIPIADRQEGCRMAKALQPGDIIVATKIDRLFRNFLDVVNTTKAWAGMGVKLRVLNIGDLDLSSGIGKFILNLFALIAELERDWISERTRDGLSAREKATGIRNGNAPTGYIYVGSGRGRRIISDTKMRQWASEAIELRQAGYTYEGIWRKWTYERHEARSRANQIPAPSLIHDWIRIELGLREREATKAKKENECSPNS